MNRPIRRVAAAIGVLMLALLLNLNYVQVVKSSSYRNNPDNARVLLDEYSRQRGSIIVQGSAVASSVKTNDRLKYLRTYPKGKLYANLTGYYSFYYGSSNLESTESSLLTGDDDRLFTSRFTDLITGRDPRGGNVVLTINAKAQEAAYAAMGNRRGAVVAINPKTGAILAAVSTPSYDPSVLSSHDANSINAYWTQLTKDPSQPMLDRALNQTYPPGSVFKIVDSAAALQHGKSPSSLLPAPDVLTLPGTNGATLSNFDGESCSNNGRTTLAFALTISCNTAFAQLALTLGTSAIKEQAAKFGIDGPPLNVPLPVAASTVGPINDQGALAQSAIGQRDVRITPLQAAMLSAAVANNGVLMKPYLVAQEQAPNLTVLSSATPQVLSTPIDPADNAKLVQMMEDVVNSSAGTGHAAQIPGVTVAGKTGTADTGELDTAANPHAADPDAWFSGFAPAGNPQIAVAVIVENGGVSGSETTGGLAAAPVAAKVIQAYLNSTGR
jgi:peptidoglycan glycosyltransferase